MDQLWELIGVGGAIGLAALALSLFQEWRHWHEARPEFYLREEWNSADDVLELDLRIYNHRNHRISVPMIEALPSGAWHLKLVGGSEHYLNRREPSRPNVVLLDHSFYRLGPRGTTTSLASGETQPNDRMLLDLGAFPTGSWSFGPLGTPLVLRATFESRGWIVSRHRKCLVRMVRVSSADDNGNK